MTLLQNTIGGLRYKHWTLHETFAYFLKGLARELKITPDFFLEYHKNIVCRNFKKKWQKRNANGEWYLDFNGAKLPDISANKNDLYSFASLYEDVFLIPCFYNDSYDKKLAERLDQYMLDGPYGYRNDKFDVTIKNGDVVIDAGAWFGDFSAYAVSKGAIAYAFEPLKENYKILTETARINNGQIHPVQKGLGSSVCDMNISINGASSSIILKEDGAGEEKISITTLDKFVEESKLERIDFIKADIEGAEREMLKGAFNTLKTFTPKLAICTYHLPDDPEVLEKIILEANPAYKVVHLQHKLFAAVVGE